MMRNRLVEPRASVVIPTFNRARDLRRCLESLRAQTVGDFEVIVCDDGSTDDTATVAAEYAGMLDLTYDHAANSGGPAAPRNRGIRAARAPYVAFLDSDDWWLPQKLEMSLDYLERGADLVYHDLFMIRRVGKRRSWRRVDTWQVAQPVFADLLSNGNALTTSSVVVRTELLRGIGGFSEDPDLAAVEDYDAWLRLARTTNRFARIPRTLGCYWAGGGNITSPARMLGNLAALERRYVDAGDALPSSHWVSYARGRAFYQLGSYSAAKPFLERVHWPRAPFSRFMKSQWMLRSMALFGARRSTS